MSSLLTAIEDLKSSLHEEVVAINLCVNRANLISGLLAVLARNGRTIFPNDISSKSINAIGENSKNVVILVDQQEVDNFKSRYNLPVVAIQSTVEHNCFFKTKELSDFIEENAHSGFVEHFTSGSTGTPIGWVKTMEEIIKGTAKTYNRLAELNALDTNDNIVATVPAQHMYGFENSIMIAMLYNVTIYSGQPFYPQDIANVCAIADGAVCLITTPFHLQTLISSDIQIDNIKSIICATAKLSKQLSIDAEKRFNCTVIEIYGSTESGVLGIRKTAKESQFTPLPGIEFLERNGGWFYVSDHLNSEIPMNDQLNLSKLGLFTLAGRSDDMIKVAGKRASLAGINNLLQSIEGVGDGIFYMPAQNSNSRIKRPIIFWVPNGINKENLRTELLKIMDPVFVPRIIIPLNSLPRDDNGKISQQKLDMLWYDYQKAKK